MCGSIFATSTRVSRATILTHYKQQELKEVCDDALHLDKTGHNTWSAKCDKYDKQEEFKEECDDV